MINNKNGDVNVIKKNLAVVTLKKPLKTSIIHW